MLESKAKKKLRAYKEAIAKINKQIDKSKNSLSASPYYMLGAIIGIVRALEAKIERIEAGNDSGEL